MRKLLVAIASFSIMLGILIVAGKNNNKPIDNSLIPDNKSTPLKLDLQQALQKIDRTEIEADLRYLCSPALEGRMSGMKGNDTAGKWMTQKFQSFGLATQSQTFAVKALNEHNEKSSGQSSNIIGILAGNHPTLKDEFIVVGAHYDHIGYGPAMSQAASRREIHQGADDNASGATALVSIAKASSLMKGKNNRTIVFVGFSGEEMGLYGAKHYVGNMASNVVFMLNMDMVGRYNNKGSIACLGAGSSAEVRTICERLTGYPFRPNITNDSGGGSDHIPFYNKRIPVCFLHTGQHNDYHTPDDTPDKIDFNGLTWVAKFATHVVWEVDKLERRPNFMGVVRKENDVFKDHGY